MSEEESFAGHPSGTIGVPAVSVCIPAFQAERHLQATLDSVLAQNYPNLEIVVVDNNSTDGTRSILEAIDDSRLRVIRNATTLPIADNFNLAIRRSRGMFVKLVCADDTLEPECVTKQADVLFKNANVALVAARTNFIDDDGELLRRGKGLAGIVGRLSGEQLVRQMVRSGTNPVGPPVAAMFRRVDFDRSGGFRGELPFTMDMELWTRLVRYFDFYGLPATLASFRIGTDSMTALTSGGSQLAQHLEFQRRVAADPQWETSTADHRRGRARSYATHLRRTGLYLMSRSRCSLRRHRIVGNTTRTVAAVRSSSES